MTDIEVIQGDDVVVVNAADATSIIVALEDDVEVIQTLGAGPPGPPGPPGPIGEVPASRSIIAGTGLTGGGDLSLDRTLALTVPVAVVNGGTGTTSGISAATQAALDGKVAKAGDTMSGALTTPALQAGTGALVIASVAVNIGYSIADHPNGGMAFRPSADSNNAISFLNAANTVVVGTIFQTATATAYNTSSDERLKDNFESFDAGLIVDETNVYSFTFKSVPGERAYGVSAQQACEVFPQAVTYVEKDDWYGIDYSKYVPVLLHELKSLRERVAQLEAQAAPK